MLTYAQMQNVKIKMQNFGIPACQRAGPRQAWLGYRRFQNFLILDFALSFSTLIF